VQDAIGRDGVAVGYRHDGWRDVMIFSPETSELLGESDGSTEASPVVSAKMTGRGSATIEHLAAYTETGVTDSTTERP
jgi:hypothetical protein